MKGYVIYYWVDKNKWFIINGYKRNLVCHPGLKYKETMGNKMNKSILKSKQECVKAKHRLWRVKVG